MLISDKVDIGISSGIKQDITYDKRAILQEDITTLNVSAPKEQSFKIQEAKILINLKG